MTPRSFFHIPNVLTGTKSSGTYGGLHHSKLTVKTKNDSARFQMTPQKINLGDQADPHFFGPAEG